MDTLDGSIRSLLRVISQIKDVSRSAVSDLLTTSKPYWHLCSEKFHAAYTKAKNPEGFRDMFNTFFEKHIDKFTEEVVDEDGDINDEWLKNKEVISKSSKKKKSDDYSFSLKNINCRGEIIYFDESNEKIRNVSIPITEAYLAACKIYSDGAKNGEYSPLPAQLLFNLFNVMSFVCDESYADKVKKNVKALKEIIDNLTDETEQNDTETGSTLNPITGVMKTFAKKFGLDGSNGAGGFNIGNIEKTVSSLFSDDVADKMKNVFNSFTEKVNLGDAKDIGSIISNVSDAMKDPALQENLKETLSSVASKVGFGEINFTEEDKQKINPEGASAVEQE